MVASAMIKYEIQDGVYLIELDNGKANVIDGELIDQIMAVLDIARSDTSHGIVLTARGGFFSAGVDVKYLLSLKSKTELAVFFRKLDELLYQLFCFPKPCIAAVNGHSIGGGLLIQMCSDYCYAQHDVKIKFGFPEINIGLSIGSLMSEIISFVMKSKKSISTMLYSGELFSASDALHHGIIDEIIDGSELVIKAKEKVLKCSKSHPEAFTAMKRVLRRDAMEKMSGHLLFDQYADVVELMGNEKTQQVLRNI